MNGNYCPPLCNTQGEFDAEMARLDEEQSNELKPYCDKRSELVKKRASLMTQRSAINIQLDMLRCEYTDNEDAKREIDGKYRAMKHELIVLNPKEKFQNEQDEQ